MFAYFFVYFVCHGRPHMCVCVCLCVVCCVRCVCGWFVRCMSWVCLVHCVFSVCCGPCVRFSPKHRLFGSPTLNISSLKQHYPILPHPSNPFCPNPLPLPQVSASSLTPQAVQELFRGYVQELEMLALATGPEQSDLRGKAATALDFMHMVLRELKAGVRMRILEIKQFSHGFRRGKKPCTILI